MEFYEDTKENYLNDELTKKTLEEFFENTVGAEIIYVAKKAGKDDLKIGNATDEKLIAEIRYGTINRQIQAENKDFKTNLKMNVPEMNGELRFHWQNSTDYYKNSLDNKSQKEIIHLDAHSSGKTLKHPL